MAGQLADGFFDRKPPPPPKGGPLDFSRWSSAPLSKPIPVVYGTAWVEGVPLYVDKANLGFISEWQDVLGVPSIKGYTSGTYAQAQIAFCQGPVTSIDYVRRDKVVHHAGATGGGRFNFKHLSAADDASGATFSYQPTFTLGDASTAALWSALSAETNPFRRLAYGHLAMMRCERLAFIGGRIPSLFARVRGKLANYADPGILSESTEMGAAQTVYNALPGDVIKDVLTSALWGVGLPTGSVVTDVGADGSANSSFDRYCHARGWYIGLALTSAQSAFDVVKMILAATDSTIAVSGSTWKVIPYGDTTVGPRSGYTYTPPSVSIGIVDDDLVQASPDQDPVELDQVGEEDTRNSYPITYVPGYGWGEDEAPAESMDVASVSTTQLRRASPRSLPCIRSGIYAQQISALMAARSVYNRTTARFSLNWRHPEVEPGDFISLTHEKLGFTAKTFRALSTEEGKDGATEIEAVEWNTGVSVVPVYNPQTADGLSYSPTSGGDPAMWEAMAALAAAATAQETADGEIATYWQATAPASASYGDIWFDTDAGNAIYTWRDTGWVSTPNSGVGKAILAAATAQGTADGKARIYYQAAQPTGLGAGDQGDLWVDTDDNLKVWAWTGSAWVLAQDWYTANATANAAADRLTALGDDGIISKEEKQAFFGYVQPFRAMRDEMATAGVYTALGSTAAAALVAQFDEFKTFIHDYCGFEWDWTNPPPLDPGSQLSAIAWWSIRRHQHEPQGRRRLPHRRGTRAGRLRFDADADADGRCAAHPHGAHGHAVVDDLPPRGRAVGHARRRWHGDERHRHLAHRVLRRRHARDLHLGGDLGRGRLHVGGRQGEAGRGDVCGHGQRDRHARRLGLALCGRRLHQLGPADEAEGAEPAGRARSRARAARRQLLPPGRQDQGRPDWSHRPGGSRGGAGGGGRGRGRDAVGLLRLACGAARRGAPRDREAARPPGGAEVMALPSSGVLKLSDIKVEFGGATPPANLRAYLKDATPAYVVSAGAKVDYAPNVPSSGNMEIRDFLGAAKNKLVVGLSVPSVEAFRAWPPTGTAITGSVTCTVSGGSGNYSYSWWLDGSSDSGWTIWTPTAASTVFRHTIASADAFWIAYAGCTVTDNVTGFTAATTLCTVSAEAGANPGLSISCSPASVSAWVYNGSGSTGTYTLTATASGGTAPLTYAWTRSGTNHTFGGGTSAATTCSHSYSAAAAQTTDTYTCTVTDAYGQTAQVSVSVTFGCRAALSFASSPGNVSASVTSPATATTGASSGSGAGGTGSYSYAWTYVSGTSFNITSASSASTTFSKYYSASASESGVYRLTISDGYSTPVSTTITVSMTAAAALSVSLSATAADGSAARASGSFTCTPSITATPSGGTPGYSYLWERVSGDTFTVSGSTTATATFSHSKVVVGMWSGVYRCKVTDSLSTVVYSGNVTVTGEVY